MSKEEQKANELIEKFGNHKAILCIEEIIESSPSLPILSDNGTYGSDIEESKVYWQGVKEHLLKLKQ